MEVRTPFCNENLDDIYMDQRDGVHLEGKKHIMCKFKKSIYGLKHAFRYDILSLMIPLHPLNLRKSLLIDIYIYIYLKVSGRKFIFLIMYFDDIFA